MRKRIARDLIEKWRKIARDLIETNGFVPKWNYIGKNAKFGCNSMWIFMDQMKHSDQLRCRGHSTHHNFPLCNNLCNCFIADCKIELDHECTQPDFLMDVNKCFYYFESISERGIHRCNLKWSKFLYNMEKLSSTRTEVSGLITKFILDFKLDLICISK